MSDQLTFNATLKIAPPSTLIDTSGLTETKATLLETMSVGLKMDTKYVLATDGAEAVSFGDIAQAHYVMLKSDGKVSVALTSADGTSQIIPVDGLFVLFCNTVPVTAITLTRVVGIDTEVRVILAEAS